MESDPAKAAPQKRKFRRIQFRLRTLLIVVTLFAVPCGYVGWQAKIARERKSMLEKPRVAALEVSEAPDAIPWIRRCLGDHAHTSIIVGGELTDNELEEVRDAFPESRVERENPLTEDDVEDAKLVNCVTDGIANGSSIEQIAAQVGSPPTLDTKNASDNSVFATVGFELDPKKKGSIADESEIRSAQRVAYWVRSVKFRNPKGVGIVVTKANEMKIFFILILPPS